MDTGKYRDKKPSSSSHPSRKNIILFPHEKHYGNWLQRRVQLIFARKEISGSQTLRKIDINARAIKEGNAYFRQEGIKNVNLIIHRADKLKQFADKSIDVIFTDATLMYIGSDKIGKVIQEARRVSRKGLIFSEWDCEDNSREYLWLDGHWIYNYKTLLAKYFPSGSIKIFRHPEGLWEDESWSKFGAIIEVRL